MSFKRMNIYECGFCKNLKDYTFICFWRDFLISKAKILLCINYFNEHFYSKTTLHSKRKKEIASMLLRSDGMRKITIKCNDNNKMLTLKILHSNIPSSFETKVLRKERTCHLNLKESTVSKLNKKGQLNHSHLPFA